MAQEDLEHTFPIDSITPLWYELTMSKRLCILAALSVFASCAVELVNDSDDNGDAIKMQLQEKEAAPCISYLKEQPISNWIDVELSGQKLEFGIGQDFQTMKNKAIEEVATLTDSEHIGQLERRETNLLMQSIFGITPEWNNDDVCTLSKDVSYMDGAVVAYAIYGSCLQDSTSFLATFKQSDDFVKFYVNNDVDPFVDKGGKTSTIIAAYGTEMASGSNFYRAQVENTNNDVFHNVDKETYDMTRLAFSNSDFELTFKSNQSNQIVVENIYTYNEDYNVVSTFQSTLTVTDHFTLESKGANQYELSNINEKSLQVMEDNGYTCLDL